MGSASGDSDALSGLDGEELYSTDVSDRRPGGPLSSGSDGFSTDVIDNTRKRRRAGLQGAPI